MSLFHFYFSKIKGGKLIAEGTDPLSFTNSPIEIANGKTTLIMKPNGGFIMVLG